MAFADRFLFRDVSAEIFLFLLLDQILGLQGRQKLFFRDGFDEIFVTSTASCGFDLGCRAVHGGRHDDGGRPWEGDVVPFFQNSHFFEGQNPVHAGHDNVQEHQMKRFSRFQSLRKGFDRLDAIPCQGAFSIGRAKMVQQCSVDRFVVNDQYLQNPFLF